MVFAFVLVADQHAFTCQRAEADRNLIYNITRKPERQVRILHSYQPRTTPIPELCFHQRPGKFSVATNKAVSISIRFSNLTQAIVRRAHLPKVSSYMMESSPSSNRTAFFSVPSPEISTSTWSPSFNSWRGFWNIPTPAGVPVMTTV